MAHKRTVLEQEQAAFLLALSSRFLRNGRGMRRSNCLELNLQLLSQRLSGKATSQWKVGLNNVL